MSSTSVQGRIVALALSASVAVSVRAGFHTYQNCDPVSGNCPNIAIPDLGSATLTLYVPPDPNGANLIANIAVGVWVTHTYQGDLEFDLTSPAGTTVTLLNRPGIDPQHPDGFSADDFGGTYIVTPPPTLHFASFYMWDAAATTYDAPQVPYPGYNKGWDPNLPPLGNAWKPINPLALFRGENQVGVWTLTVSDHAAGDVGQIHYLQLDITSETLQPPIAALTGPNAFTCFCTNTPLIGTADDPGGFMDHWVLEWSKNSNGPWTPIASGTNSVQNGTLAAWNTSGVPGGYTLVRLTVFNQLGLSAVSSTAFYVSQAFEVLHLTAPANGSIVGGTVCFGGTAWSDCFADYRIDYAPANSQNYTNILTSTNFVYAGGLGSFDTRSLADGNYKFRLTGTTVCGVPASEEVTVTVDNTPPVGHIASPLNCGPAKGVVQVMGTATDAHFGGWTLQYTGGAANGWVTIASGTTPVSNGLLAPWDTTHLPACAYTLRLLVSDAADVNCISNNEAEYTVSVGVGYFLMGDLNCDGIVDFNDINAFVACLTNGGHCSCP